LADNEFMAEYRAAIARYTEADFEAFFSLAEITDSELRALGKDFLGAAGSLFLSHIERQRAQLPRGETIKHLNKAKKASRALAKNLTSALQDRSVVGSLTELAPSIRSAYPTDADKSKDSYKILDAIFPLASKGQGFRYEGLAQALMMLSQCIDAIEDEAIKKPDKGRSHAMRPWMILMVFYWIEATGTAPRSGHYDSEVSEYSSMAVAAFTATLQKLDPEISERLVVQALGAATQSLEKSPLEASLLMSAGFLHLIASGGAHSKPETLRACLGLPEGEFNAFADMSMANPDPADEQAILTREEFYETFKSSGLEKMLLQTSIEADDD